MAYCSNCGKLIDSDAKFCKECGAAIKTENASDTPKRQLEYQGSVIKCPSCGSEVPSMSPLCPACGHEFNSIKITDTLKAFQNELDICEKEIVSEPRIKKGWSSWSTGKKFWWIVLNLFTGFIPLLIQSIKTLIKYNSSPKLTESEKKKYNLIYNLTLPSDRGAILEVLRFIQGKLKLISESHVSGNDAYWAKVWKSKAAEIEDQANILIGDDSLIVSISSKINQTMSIIKKKIIIRLLVSVVLCAIILTCIYFRTPKDIKSQIAEYNTTTVTQDSKAQIFKNKIILDGWIAENFEIGDKGCSFYIKENGNVGIIIDIICNKNVNDSISLYFIKDDKDINNYKLTSGAFNINNLSVDFDVRYRSKANSVETQLFINSLLAMEEGQEEELELEVETISNYKEQIFNASTLAISCELKYELNDGQNTDVVEIK